MQKAKSYRRVRFGPDALAEGLSEWAQTLPDEKPDATSLRAIAFDEENWRYDSDEEFLAEVAKAPSSYHYLASFRTHSFEVGYHSSQTTVTVGAPTRPPIERVFRVFDRYALQDLLPEEELSESPPSVFIGHGRDPQWRDLKDHLHEQHGYDVQAYEIGSRAGHAIRDILEEMMEESSFALLVFTGEDVDHEGHLRARQNVVHELGLFQGSLGFSRAVVLLEEGTDEFSNIQGIHQIRFPRGHIREVFGDVLAVLRREFGEPPA